MVAGPHAEKNGSPESNGKSPYFTQMKSLVPYTGYEVPVKDYFAAIKILNHDSDLGLDSKTEEVLGLVFTELSFANRYRGDPFIHPEKGENSATHGVQCVPLLNEMFRRAREQILAKGGTIPDDFEDSRQICALAVLIHDCGEIFGEFSSLAERAQRKSLVEMPDIERQIFQFTFELASYAVERGTPSLFSNTIREMREDAELKRLHEDLRNGVDIENIGKAFNGILEKYRPVGLTDDARYEGLKWVKLFDLSELKDEAKATPRDLFLGYTIKACEHMQGTQHFTRFSEKDARVIDFEVFGDRVRNLMNGDGAASLKLPISLTQSLRIVKNMMYVESEVGDLFHWARSEWQWTVAQKVRDSIYQTVEDCLKVMTPVTDRRAKDLSPRVEDILIDESLEPHVRVSQAREILEKARSSLAQGHVRQRLEILQKEEAAAASEAEREVMRKERFARSLRKLFPIETRPRMVALYRAARERDYIPQRKEILFKFDELPEALSPLPLEDLRI